MWQRTIDGLGLAVQLRSMLPELDDGLASVLRSYADHPGPPALDYRFEGGTRARLTRDDVVLLETEHAIDLIGAFELDFNQRLIALVPGIPLHAGAVVSDAGRALVVAGRSGAGKSTLVRGLLGHGLRYLSEECVALPGERRCIGLARALHIDDETPLPSGFRCELYPIRSLTPGRFRLFHPPEARIWRGEAQVAAVIAIEHGPGAPDSLVRLTGGAALAALWPAIFRQTDDSIASFSAAFAGVPMYRLHTTAPERALGRALDLARELGLVAA